MNPTDFISNSTRLVFLPNSSGNELESLKNFEKSSLSPLLNCTLQLLTCTLDIKWINGHQGFDWIIGLFRRTSAEIPTFLHSLRSSLIHVSSYGNCYNLLIKPPRFLFPFHSPQIRSWDSDLYQILTFTWIRFYLMTFLTFMRRIFKRSGSHFCFISALSVFIPSLCVYTRCQWFLRPKQPKIFCYCLFGVSYLLA